MDTPLVLHGGTGIPQEDIQRAIKEGINKVNVGTIIHCTYMNNLREELNRAGDNPYTLDVMKAVYPKVKEVVKTLDTGLYGEWKGMTGKNSLQKKDLSRPFD